ncbi:MAG: hypothetical protein HY644_14930 [Acidobacteria bacterium]|nr:hypothetical protein [Acidobacteriota bacterium]
MDPVKFVEWAVWYANQRAAKLTPLRIVKFLYLADLYHARTSNGCTLTGWVWKFVHYGPFCGEVLNAISASEKRGLITGIPYASKFDKDTRLYIHAGNEEPEGFPDTLPFYVCSEIKRAIETWADDTYGLLNHVYFHTEPMSEAQPGAVLDFSRSEMPLRERPIEMKRLSKTQIKRGRDLLQSLRQSRVKRATIIREACERSTFDAAYFQGVEFLDDQESSSSEEFHGILDLTS